MQIAVAERIPLVGQIVSLPRLELWSGAFHPFDPNSHPLLRPGRPTVRFSAMAFPLSVAVHPSVVCFSHWPTVSRTFHLPHFRLGNILLPFSHLRPRRPFSLRPLPRAMPISRPSSRWQRQTKGVCLFRKTPAPSSSLET